MAFDDKWSRARAAIERRYGRQTVKYVRVKNWWQFQHYDPAKRTPPWIKFYSALLDPTKHPKFATLSDRAKLTLHHLRALASTIAVESKDETPLIPYKWVNSDRLNMTAKPRLKELVDAGFVAIGTASELASANADKPDDKKASATPLARSSALSESLAFDSPEGVQGEPSPPAPDFAAVARVVAFLRPISWRQAPPEQVVVGWVQRYGESAVLEAVRPRIGKLSGKSYLYLETILAEEAKNPPVDGRPDPEAARRMAILEEARALKADAKRGKAPEDAAEYLTWLAPDGVIRDDAKPLDEWRESRGTM